MTSSIALAISIVLAALVLTNGETCDCHPIQNWSDLRSLIMTKTHAKNEDVQVDLPLCPFNIVKNHQNSTYHWSEIIYISSPIHIYCKKENPTDSCAVTVVGEACEGNKNCGRQLFKIMSDDVWIQGLTIKDAKDVAVNIDKGFQNAKLIDMTFIGGEVPENNSTVSAGVVLGEKDSNVEVLNSSFMWNRATPIFSRGSLVIYGSYFMGNRGTKIFQRGGAILSLGETVIAKSKFLYNWAAPNGLAIWTNNENMLDAGGNCFKSKGNFGCQGINLKDECFKFIGWNTMCEE